MSVGARGPQVDEALLFLGVDGGGTQCRARLCDRAGSILGEGVAGPANIRLGLDESFGAVLDATDRCLADAKLAIDSHPIVACLALAGASEPIELAAAQQYRHPFRQMIVTTDAHAACVGAHRGEDGGVIIVGTGSGRHGRCLAGGTIASAAGAFRSPTRAAVRGSAARSLRRVLWAHDGRIPWTGLLRACLRAVRIRSPCHRALDGPARPRDFARLAPLVVEHARAGRSRPLAS